MDAHTISDLAQILAAADAVFAPIRDFDGSLNANAYHARRDYPEQGVRFVAGGEVAARKDAERRLGRMEDAGLVTTYRRQGRTRGVRLTPVGEDTARRLVGLPLLPESLQILAIVADFLEREPTTLSDLWAAESAVINKPWGGPSAPFAVLEDELLPVMVAGLAEARCTVLRHAYYAITPAGWAALDADDFPTPAGEGAYTPAARSEYLEAFRLARTRLTEADPDPPGEIGPCPLPVSIKGVPLGVAS